nr:unnamed protein product [Callosobruchus chinensis]
MQAIRRERIGKERKAEKLRLVPSIKSAAVRSAIGTPGATYTVSHEPLATACRGERQGAGATCVVLIESRLFTST